MENQQIMRITRRPQRFEVLDRLQKILDDHSKLHAESFTPMTRKDAAKYLCICPETLTKHFNNGLIKGTKIGRKYLFAKQDLDRFLNSVL